MAQDKLFIGNDFSFRLMGQNEVAQVEHVHLGATEGVEGIGKVGLRFPIPPYGTQMDPTMGMGKSYPGGVTGNAGERQS